MGASAVIETQTKLVLDNLLAVLKADGMDLSNIVATTVYLKDLNNFSKMSAAYGAYFRVSPPARATVEVARLPRDAQVEISAIAVRSHENATRSAAASRRQRRVRRHKDGSHPA